jgi:hypothetical protein
MWALKSINVKEIQSSMSRSVVYYHQNLSKDYEILRKSSFKPLNKITSKFRNVAMFVIADL